MKIYQVTKIRK